MIARSFHTTEEDARQVGDKVLTSQGEFHAFRYYALAAVGVFRLSICEGEMGCRRFCITATLTSGIKVAGAG